MVQTAHDISATEETGAKPVAAAGTGSATKEPTRAFLNVARRDLTDEELASPAVRRFLIAEIERLDEICTDQRSFVTGFHDQRVTIAMLTEQASSSRWNEILFVLCLSVGSAGVGAAPSYFAIGGAAWTGSVILALSLILIGAGIASRIWK